MDTSRETHAEYIANTPTFWQLHNVLYVLRHNWLALKLNANLCLFLLKKVQSLCQSDMKTFGFSLPKYLFIS